MRPLDLILGGFLQLLTRKFTLCHLIFLILSEHTELDWHSRDASLSGIDI